MGSHAKVGVEVVVRTVQLLATGGTIASRATAGGGSSAVDGSAALLAAGTWPGDVEVVSRDVLCRNSFALTLADMQRVLDAVLAALVDPALDGVVVTHGTDTMEETAFLVDLFLWDERPVVFTGAQRSADAPDGDGPGNLSDAVSVAAAPGARGFGALIVFDGAIFAACGTRKTHTLAPAAFAAPDAGPLGGLTAGVPWFRPRRAREALLDSARLRLQDVRVDIVAVYPGCDTAALDAVVAAGAGGVVLEATGAGNANPAVRDAVARLVTEGVTVLLSTRVHAGPVVPLYAGGGGADLVAAGAIPTGVLRPGQARILLAALLGTGADGDHVRDALHGPVTRAWADRTTHD